MKRLFLILAFVLNLSAPITFHAQERGADLALATEKVDALFAQWDKQDSPGCALAVIKDGQVIYKRGYGSATPDSGMRISSSPRSIFNIASTSKQFTAASVALLSTQGKISLDDDIRKYLPEIPTYPTSVTIRHLIYHTSRHR